MDKKDHPINCLTRDLRFEKRSALRRHGARLAVIAAGGSLCLLGLVMFVTPGPGSLVLPFGLYLLAREFDWAERLYTRLIERLPAKLQRKFRAASPTRP